MKSLLHRYEDAGYVIQRKARMLAILCIAVLVVLPFSALYSVLIGSSQPIVIAPTLIGMVPILAAFVLLVKGRFTEAGHTVLTTSTVVIWTVFIVDSHTALIKLDTIAYIYGVMCMVPLLVVQQKLEVLTYCALNLIMFIVFSVVWLPVVAINSGSTGAGSPCRGNARASVPPTL